MTQGIAIAYIPVLHKGYLHFIEELKKESVEALYLVGDQILQAHAELDYINRKDRLRAVPLQELKKALEAITDLQIHELTLEALEEIKKSTYKIIVPQEDLSSFIAEQYFKGRDISFKNIFLRWNRENIGETKEPQGDEIELDAFQKGIMGRVLEEALKSADWWRQVGAAIVKDGEVIAIAHNEHMPEAQLPNLIGDTRSLFKKGININYVTSAHAEGNAISQAAKQGKSTEGAEMYVTDFPCPYCARMIVKAGIKKVYYQTGYAVLEGDTFLKEEGVEIVRIAEM